MIIEKGIPIPKIKRGRPPKYPFSEMEVGDSFAVSKEDVKNVRNCASRFTRINGGWFFVVSQKGSWRCWRMD